MKTKYYNKINSKEMLLVGGLLLCFTFSAKAQVTIGVQAPPLQGVLLDLKQSDQPNGDANSMSGIMFARVLLSDTDKLSPILDDTVPNYATLKAQYTDLIVYNVNPNAPFEKGLYEWDGNRWNPISNSTSTMQSVKAMNGLSASGSDTVLLGGDLMKNTTINLGDSNLIFNRGQGKLGIGTISPQAIMHIANPDSIDPLIMENVKLVSDTNTIDGANPMYYNLRVSEGGVIRKAIPVVSVHDNSSFVYNLVGTTSSSIPYTPITSNSNTSITWTKDGTQYNYVTLPEDGTYAFSFRLYGNTNIPTQTNVSSSFYLTAVKNGTPFYTKEGVIFDVNAYHAATYTINITVTGIAGDQVGFTMGLMPGGGITEWDLIQGNATASNANRTSMFFWRL